jgi:hypothetical protein
MSQQQLLVMLGLPLDLKLVLYVTLKVVGMKENLPHDFAGVDVDWDERKLLVRYYGYARALLKSVL